MKVDAETRLFALLGNPVSHSLSPTMQSAAFSAVGLNAVYVALRCDSAAVPVLMGAIARAGGGGNITLPHKQTALAGLEVRSPAVDATGACNTFWWEDGMVHGDNTDVEGFASATDALMGSIHGRSALVLGAGGAARAAVFAMLEGGARSITVASRDERKSRKLATDLDADGERVRVAAPDAYRDAAYDLIVNATPLGIDDNDDVPILLPAAGRVGAVLDLVYRPDSTPLIHHAAALGIPARDGFDMLLAQGAAAFERWFGRPAPIDVMRAALLEGQ